MLNLIIVNNHLELESIYKCQRSKISDPCARDKGSYHRAIAAMRCGRYHKRGERHNTSTKFSESALGLIMLKLPQ